MCEICKKNPCDYRYPNYAPSKVTKYCVICKEGIQSGEEYIGNYRNEFVHFECIQGIRWLLNWLDYETQEANYENDHYIN